MALGAKPDWSTVSGSDTVPVLLVPESQTAPARVRLHRDALSPGSGMGSPTGIQQAPMEKPKAHSIAKPHGHPLRTRVLRGRWSHLLLQVYQRGLLPDAVHSAALPCADFSARTVLCGLVPSHQCYFPDLRHTVLVLGAGVRISGPGRLRAHGAKTVAKTHAQGDIINYWVEHVAMLAVPIYLVVSGRYQLMYTTSWYAVGYLVTVLYHFVVLEIAAIVTGVNISTIMVPQVFDSLTSSVHRPCCFLLGPRTASWAFLSFSSCTFCTTRLCMPH